jgi:hypothetical protein
MKRIGHLLRHSGWLRAGQHDDKLKHIGHSLTCSCGVECTERRRQAEEPLAKFNFSFSPGFSLGSQPMLNFVNRFNGFRRCAEIFNISM